MRSITHTKHNLGLDLKSLKQENPRSAKREKKKKPLVSLRKDWILGKTRGVWGRWGWWGMRKTKGERWGKAWEEEEEGSVIVALWRVGGEEVIENEAIRERERESDKLKKTNAKQRMGPHATTAKWKLRKNKGTREKKRWVGGWMDGFLWLLTTQLLKIGFFFFTLNNLYYPNV